MFGSGYLQLGIPKMVFNQFWIKTAPKSSRIPQDLPSSALRFTVEVTIPSKITISEKPEQDESTNNALQHSRSGVFFFPILCAFFYIFSLIISQKCNCRNLRRVATSAENQIMACAGLGRCLLPLWTVWVCSLETLVVWRQKKRERSKAYLSLETLKHEVSTLHKIQLASY